MDTNFKTRGSTSAYAYSGVEPEIITAADARTLLGNVSDMWLHRRLTDQTSEFPQPIVIAGRRYWRVAELRNWIDTQAARTRRGALGAMARPLSIPAAEAAPARRGA